MGYVDGQLDYLERGRDVGQWHVGDELRGDFVGVWGFACAAQAAALPV